MTRQEILEAVKNGVSLAGKDLKNADLRYADLKGAKLEGADLRYADLEGANLKGAKLEGANLRYADLSGADLKGAKLEGANLRYADLKGAKLEGANLRDADLTGANLSGADLSVAKMPSDVKVDDLHRAMYDATKCEGALDMSAWHDESCGTTHCRAGWAITLAGPEGADLEEKYGAGVAGTIIYHNSVGIVPNFYCDNDKAMADIRKCAGLK